MVHFFRTGDDYLISNGLKKAIFIPLQRILNEYHITSYIGVVWTLNMKMAYEAIKNKVQIEYTQVGGGRGDFEVEIPKVNLLRNNGRGGDVMLIGACSFFLTPLRRYLDL